MSGAPLDLGRGHVLTYVAWSPDRALNPHYAHLADVEHYGAIIEHPRLDTGEPCDGGFLLFVGVVQHELAPDRPVWRVLSWEPLSLMPSVLCRRCGDHGFVAAGQWVPA